MNGNGTPSGSRYASQGAAASSSTPTHHAVARLRGQRSSFTPPQARDSAYSTPNRRDSSTGGAYASSSSSSSTPDVFSSPAAGTPRLRKGQVRVVKRNRKAWWQRLAEIPLDLWDKYELALNENILLDADALADLGYPAGSATLILHILLRLSVGASDVIVSGSKSGSKSRLSSSAEARLEELRRASQGRLARLSGGRSLVYMLARSLCWLFVLVSIANAVWLFTRRRQYRLFMRSDPINSPNAKTVKVNSSMQTEEEASETRPLWKRSLTAIWEAIAGAQAGKRTEQRQIQELAVWDPPLLSLRYFAIYSPPLALFTQFMDRTNLFSFSIAAAFLLIQTWGLIHIYSQTLQDRLTISKEVMHEYDAKFVNPRINYARKDASTMTNEAEMVDVRSWRYGSGGSSSARKSNGRASQVY